MSGIKGKNTKPEILIRKALHKKGYRYRLHDKKLLGKPDIILSKYRAVILVNGCFWHGHDCHLFKWPSTRPDFWKNKIEGNKLRDAKVRGFLSNAGWKVLTVWECALKGKARLDLDQVVETIEYWLQNIENECHDIRGKTQ